MTAQPDRLYNLLPAVYRQKDAAQGYPLRALLSVISEQVNIVEADIAQLYEDWFIETCQDWVVPYIGDLIGYKPVADAAQLGSGLSSRDVTRRSILISRSEVANTIRYRRRKGTLSILEDLAGSVSAWPSAAMEFYRLLSVTQNIAYIHHDRGRTADLRNGRNLEDIGGAFDRLARTANIRRIDSRRTPGRHNTASVGLFVWRLQVFSVTQTHAYCHEEEGPHCFMFNPLGNDTQLYTNPRSKQSNTGNGLTALNFPTPIRRRNIDPVQRVSAVAPDAPAISDYYGPGKSFEIWLGSLAHPVTAEEIVAADLSKWSYHPKQGQVAVDPKLGRLVLPPGNTQRQSVWVSYYYGFSSGIGGGEYDRPVTEPPGATIYLVGPHEAHRHIGAAIKQWFKEAPQHGVIEITDSGVYTEQLEIALAAGQTLQLRAANRKRPVIRLLDWQTQEFDNMTVSGAADSWFIMDGLLVTGRNIEIRPEMAGVTIRHTTLVPGWGLDSSSHPKNFEASIELDDAPACLIIEHSIVGSIQVSRDEAALDPVTLHISDSIVDATAADRVALGASETECAYSSLTIVRSTVIGQVHTQAIVLAADSIFMGNILACRRQKGCMRFCYVKPGSQTPRRYECQPDKVLPAAATLPATGARAQLLASEQRRVAPEFKSTRYGTADYCQLAVSCASEIVTGASDESEMGVFHDLYQPQRASNLAGRLSEYTPAGLDVAIIYAS